MSFMPRRLFCTTRPSLKPHREVGDGEIGLGVADAGLDLQPVADDAGIGHQPLAFGRRVARHHLRIEAIEGPPEIVALAQDGDPRQASLKAIEQQLLEQGARIIFGHAPLLVVVAHVKRIRAAPAAAADAILMLHGGHGQSLLRATS
jgi:hypothetical protein